MIEAAKRAAQIAALNDRLRVTGDGGRVFITGSLANAPQEIKEAVITKIRLFTEFDDENNPHGEHDFVSVKVGTEVYFAKIDYYDKSMEGGSPDPADPSVTERVMSIFHSSDY